MLTLGFITQSLHALPIEGLLGGTTYNGALYYSYCGAFNASTSPVNLLGESQQNGYIASVALNTLGAGLIGGSTGTSGYAYAALVSSNGQLTSLLGNSMTGTISGVALNDFGNGIFYGENTSTNYASLVSSSGNLTNIALLDLTSLNSVAISNTGTSLLGGYIVTTSYAAFADPLGNLENLGIEIQGAISSVAINSNGLGLIGGYNVTTPYAAFAESNRTLTPITLSTAPGHILSVALNDSNTALLGGYLQNDAYAVLVHANGTATDLLGSSVPGGSVDSVALNPSGFGLIGGHDGNGYSYVAHVFPDGTVSPVTSATIAQAGISSVAINAFGVGLIGGAWQDNASMVHNYAALVAPNGAVTMLQNLSVPAPTSNARISSVALADAIVPRATGPFTSAIYTQLAASASLNSHFLQTRAKTVNPSPQSSIALMASRNPCQTLKPIPPKSPANVLWAVPLFNYIHIQAQEQIPSYTNQVGGVLIGYDRQVDSFVLGAAFGYAFNYAHYAQQLGHAKVQEELGCLFSIYQHRIMRINAAIWGGGYQLKNERHALSITSKADAHGWILSPHLEFAFPISIKNHFKLEPFAMFDWVNNWQASFTETGASGFNLVMPSQYNSLLQSEIGLRMYEQAVVDSGLFSFEQKLCYTNQAPFHIQSASTFFVAGAASAFPVATGSTKIQNLGGFQLFSAYFPNNITYPYVALMGEALLGSSYQSYFVNFELGKRF